jgi:hypothetical protein
MNKYVLAVAMALVTVSAGAQARGGIAAPVSLNYFDATSGTGLFEANTLTGVDPAGVAFTYQITTTYSAECTWSNHTRTRYPIVHTDGANVNNTLLYVNGGHRVFGGYSLTGFGATFSSGDQIPVMGTQCKKGKNIGTWTALDTMGSDGGLYANYGSTQTLLY